MTAARPTADTGHVAWIAIAPVKSMALQFLDRADVGLNGIVGDRALAIIDDRGEIVNGKRLGTLVSTGVERGTDGTLMMSLPNGSIASGRPELGESIDATFVGHRRAARIVHGPWAAALSMSYGRALRVIAFDPGEGFDRGPSATLVSTAALAALAQAGGEDEPLDRRRFRMTFGIDGIPSHAEDGWLGRRVRIGGVVVGVAGNVGRCAVTTHDPDTGRPSFDTLRVLRRIRGEMPTTEPLPFGVWGDVVQAGAVAVGDDVTVETEGER